MQGPCAPPLPWATAGPHSSSATRVPLQPPSAPRAPRGPGEGSKTLAGTRHPHPLPGSLGNKWRVQGGCSRPFLLPLSLGLGGGGPAAPRGGGVVGTRAPLLSHLVCNTLVSGAHVLGARGVPTLYKLCRRGWSRKDSRKEEWEGHPARLMWAIPSAWEQDPRPQRKGVWPEQGGGRREGPALVPPWDGPSPVLGFLSEQSGRLASPRCTGLAPVGLGQSLARASRGCSQAWVDPVGTAGEGPERGAGAAPRPQGRLPVYLRQGRGARQGGGCHKVSAGPCPGPTGRSDLHGPSSHCHPGVPPHTA